MTMNIVKYRCSYSNNDSEGYVMLIGYLPIGSIRTVKYHTMILASNTFNKRGLQ